MLDIPAAQARNEHEMRCDPSPRWLTDTRSPEQVERAIRAYLRARLHSELQYTKRGKRGEGKTIGRVLDTARYCRREHSASIRRDRLWRSV